MDAWSSLVKFFQDNYHWIFSGVGVAVVAWIINKLAGNRNTPTSSQSMSGGSKGIQAMGDVNINSPGAIPTDDSNSSSSTADELDDNGNHDG